MPKQVNVELTSRGAIFVDDERITNRSTKWGVHYILHSFYCLPEEVVRECLIRGHQAYVNRIDCEPYLSQAAVKELLPEDYI